MSNDLQTPTRQGAYGALSRRDFLADAAALGITLPITSKLFAASAWAQTPQKGGDLKLAMFGGSATDSLDPAKFGSQVPYGFVRCWGETLVETSPTDGGPVPVLAESWDASDDAKRWAFKIRKGITFHNGKEMNVNDVVATLKRHSDESSQSGALGITEPIEDIRAEGSDLVITLREGNADLPLLLSDYHLIVQPNGGVDAPDAGIGTGPYKVTVNEPGVRHAGEHYENHWREGVGHVASVEILVINDNTARTAALTSGRVHMINRIEPKTVDLLKRLPNVVIRNVAGRGHYVFIMHCNAEPFANNDLRMALKLAMDREEILKTVLRGYGRVGNDFPINEAYPLFPEGIEQRVYDPDKAAFHYKKSRHDGPILLRTSDVAFAGAVDAAVLYQQAAAKAGIPIEIKREPGDGYWSNVWNVQPFSTSYWAGRPTQDLMYTIAYHSKAEWNDTRFLRQDFDKLLVKARAELEPARRVELYRDMALMVRDEGGLILPMFNDFIDATSDKVQGYVPDPSGELSNGFAPIRAWLAP